MIKEMMNQLVLSKQGLEDKLREVNYEIERLQHHVCPHEHMVENYGKGTCPDCQYRTKGWYCKESPTKECDYYDEENDEYDEDCCIHCGHPEERK